MDPDRCLGLYCGKMNNESGLFFSQSLIIAAIMLIVLLIIKTLLNIN